MSLIINKKLQELIKGYPTMSDKYNVTGGILEGTDPVKFGELVQLGSINGYFKAINATNPITAISQVGGFVLATNVKLAQEWPGTTVQVNPGEAFNLTLYDSWLAIELDANASTVTADAVACVAAASIDTSVVAGKTYYTRTSSAAGAGYLNDGTYAYTAVASPTGNPSTSGYYEVSVIGSDATTNYVTPNAGVAVIFATGKLTTADKVSSGTIELLPNVVFTGVQETIAGVTYAEVIVK